MSRWREGAGGFFQFFQFFHIFSPSTQKDCAGSLYICIMNKVEAQKIQTHEDR